MAPGAAERKHTVRKLFSPYGRAPNPLPCASVSLNKFVVRLDYRAAFELYNDLHNFKWVRKSGKSFFHAAPPAHIPPFDPTLRDPEHPRRQFDGDGDRYVCYGRGDYESKATKKKLTTASRRCGCLAEFTVRKYAQQYYYQFNVHTEHTGHIVGSFAEFHRRLPSSSLCSYVTSLVSLGISWGGIKDLKRPHQDDLREAEQAHRRGGEPSSALETSRITKQMFKNVKRSVDKDHKLSGSGLDCLLQRKVQLEGEGARVLFIPDLNLDDSSSRTTWIFAFCTEWQYETLQRLNPRLVLLDSTHNTAYSMRGREEKAFLYSLVAKDPESGRGLPLGFMMTPSEAASIRYCRWHLFRAVKLQSAQKIKATVDPGTTKASRSVWEQEWRSYAMQLFILLANPESEERFNIVLATMEQHLGAQSQDWKTYLRATWLPTKQRWCRAWTKDAAFSIETNNFIEAFHRVIKHDYLYKRQQQRVDHLVFVLNDRYLLDLRQEVLHIGLGVAARSVDKAERQRRDEADHVVDDVAKERVSLCENGTILVSSFTSQTRYSLQCDVHSRLISCSCPDHSLRQSICKHLYLAQRVLGRSIAFASSAAVERARQPPPRAPPAPPAAPACEPGAYHGRTVRDRRK
ncbi:hypothetical protein JCM11641_000853 [Rhodosporidiobolus odoratus]